ncbi:MAG: phenylalanine--tRNA ligase subunit alpha [Candidatus Omnitrophica bacterium]|nr:phenylalanine--tRNA ligase subunit alpha [Candidatus Omnitrophota bacterium]
MTAPIDIGEKEKRLEELCAQAVQALAQAVSAADVEKIRVRFLGRKGELTAIFQLLRDPGLDNEQKARFGQKINGAKQRIEAALEERRRSVEMGGSPAAGALDVTLPGYSPAAGRVHPISHAVSEILRIFRTLGFSAVDGPEMETEHNNFEALNIPADHPSRENFDTFYLAQDFHIRKEGGTPILLRTHTSPMQIRFMKANRPPFKIVVPGRVYRRDAVDASHCFQFHQVEGLAVGPGINFGDLKGVLTAWARGMFGKSARLRLRPHYFPFTEPSAEADLGCIFCDGKGCRVCGQKGWLEILGCGMVHPAVFKAVGYVPGTTGFAFGMGVERIAMLTYGIEDIRMFFENDIRFLRQFP